LDKDGTLLQANKTLLDYMGFTLEEMKGAGMLGGSAGTFIQRI
jgi:hypothetical protein